MKKDQFVSSVDRIFHWLGKNWQQAAVGLGTVLAIALIWWGVTAVLAGRKDAAAEAMAKALVVYGAPVGSAAPAAAPVKFATDAERLSAAEKAFEAVRSRYWLTPQASMADLFLARIALDRGDQAHAVKLLGKITSHRTNDPVVRLAMLDLVRLRFAKGEGVQLVPELEGMASGKDPRLPRDAALFQLARIWEHEGKAEEASKAYRQLVTDFPDSPYRDEAQQRLASGS
jgi:tetratricopeptide (TPR) repeat protein